MPRVKEIICNQSITINTGNFENKKVNYGEVWELTPYDNPEAVSEKLQRHVNATVHSMAENIRKVHKLKSVAFKEADKEREVQDYSVDSFEDLEKESRTIEFK